MVTIINKQKHKTGTKLRGRDNNKKRYALKTKRFVAESCLFHGAAATKSGAARAIIEAAKRIVFITVNEHEKKVDLKEGGVCCWKLRLERKEGLSDKRVLGGRSRGATGQPRKRKRTGKWVSVCPWPSIESWARLTGVEKGKEKRRNESVSSNHPPFLYIGVRGKNMRGRNGVHGNPLRSCWQRVATFVIAKPIPQSLGPARLDSHPFSRTTALR